MNKFHLQQKKWKKERSILLAEFAQGATVVQLARKYGVWRSTIYRRLARALRDSRAQ